jgi:N-acetylneuraminic acid mutarotase
MEKKYVYNRNIIRRVVRTFSYHFNKQLYKTAFKHADNGHRFFRNTFSNPPAEQEYRLQPIPIRTSAWLILLFAFSLVSPFAQAQTKQNVSLRVSSTQATEEWSTLAPSGNITPEERHEHAYVAAGNRFYLLGGRGIKPVQEYNPATNSWRNLSNSPMELHHFQAVSMGGLIYVIGAFTGRFPTETPVERVHVYNPSNDSWTEGPLIPENRRRGSAGAVVYNNKIYLVSGITNGHTSGHVTWMDEFDPASGTWRTLADAPRARDHFHAVVAGNKLYAVSGRRSSHPDVFRPTVPEVDVYDFASNQWTTLPASANIPVQVAGATTVQIGNEVLVIGGESMSQTAAHNETQALHITSNTWRQLGTLQQGRHGTQAVKYNDMVYIAAGSRVRGNQEINSQEVFSAPVATSLPAAVLMQASLEAFPNPARGEVWIEWQAPGAGAILIQLFDIRGRRVAVLHEDTLNGPQQGRFSYNTGALPEGIYFVQVAGPQYQQQLKLVVMR